MGAVWIPGVAVLQDRVLQQVDEHRNYWTPYLEITRGCPRNCTFCTAVRVSGQKMRLRPVDEVVEEIERRKLQRFFLTDDNFGLNFRLFPEYMEQLFRALAKLPLKGWTCQAEQMVAEFPDMLDLAREAHLDKFLIGFESINPGNRKELGGKGRGDIDKTRQVIKKVHEHGIGVVGLFVFGFDSDTLETFDAGYDFIRSSELDGVSATVLTPFPGTAQRETLLAAGRILPHDTWEHYDTNHVTFQPAQMTVEQLTAAYDRLCRAHLPPDAHGRARLGRVAAPSREQDGGASLLQLQHRHRLPPGIQPPVIVRSEYYHESITGQSRVRGLDLPQAYPAGAGLPGRGAARERASSGHLRLRPSRTSRWRPWCAAAATSCSASPRSRR